MLFGGSAAASGRLRRRDLPCAGGVRQQVGVSAEAVAGAFDADDDSVVEEAVQQGRGDHGIAKNLAPFGKTAV